MRSTLLSEKPIITISIQESDFDVSQVLTDMTHNDTRVGALANFIGLVRDFNDGDGVSSMFLEHYPGMTEKALREIADEACSRWPAYQIHVTHRIGLLHPGDRIVFVAVSSAHREAAFSACEFLMDYLKTKAPFWKQEQTTNGKKWVSAKDKDDVAAKRWKT